MINKTNLSTFFLSAILAFELLFFHLPDEIKLPLMLSVLLLIFLFRFSQKVIHLPKIFTLLFILLIFVYLLSGLTTGLKFQTTLEIIKLLSFTFLTVLTVNLLRESKKTHLFIFSVLLPVAVFLALVGILEFTARIASQKSLPLIEPFHYPYLSASFFLLLTPITLIIFLKSEINFKKTLSFITLVLLSIAWILTKSYLIVFLVTFLLLNLTHFCNLITNKDFRQLKVSMRDMALFILILMALLPNLFSSFGSNPIPSEIALRLDQFYFRSQSDIVGFSLASIKSHFLTGVGPGNFGSVYQAHLIKPWTWSTFAGNELLQTFVETGFLGFSAYLFILIYLTVTAVKQLYTSVKKKSLLETSVSLTVILFLGLSFTNSSLRIFPITLIFYFLTAFLLTDQEGLAIKNKILLPVLIFLLGFSVTIFADGILLNLGQRLFVQENNKMSKTVFNWLTRRPDFLLNPKALLWSAAIQIEENNHDEALNYLNQAKNVSSDSQEIDYQIANFLYNQGNIEASGKILEENIFRNPYSPPKYYLALAKIEAEKNRPAINLFWLNRASLIFPIKSQQSFSTIELSILDSTDYLNSLRSIYFSLYRQTEDKQYLNLFTQLIY